MRFLLFPFRWVDEKIQAAFDRLTLRLMHRLSCSRSVLALMLGLITVVSFVPLAAGALTRPGMALEKAALAVFFIFAGYHALGTGLEPARKRPHPWQYYILERAIVAFLKISAIGAIAVLAAIGSTSNAAAPVAAGCAVSLLGLLGSIYLQRTPSSYFEAAERRTASARVQT
ncbi:MAG: hypothetical protein WC866_00270 [Patescibacteria group bacterium]|jgi:hypothetical protein